MKPPFAYYGGKTTLAERIVSPVDWTTVPPRNVFGSIPELTEDAIALLEPYKAVTGDRAIRSQARASSPAPAGVVNSAASTPSPAVEVAAF